MMDDYVWRYMVDVQQQLDAIEKQLELMGAMLGRIHDREKRMLGIIGTVLPPITEEEHPPL